jgi:excinuclease ABC subunit C
VTVSVLDDVPGLGPARRAALLRHFGSVKRLRAASVEEIASVQGMGERTAAAVVAALAGDAAQGGAQAATVVVPAAPGPVHDPSSTDAPVDASPASTGEASGFGMLRS